MRSTHALTLGHVYLGSWTAGLGVIAPDGGGKHTLSCGLLGWNLSEEGTDWFPSTMTSQEPFSSVTSMSHQGCMYKAYVRSINAFVVRSFSESRWFSKY